MVSITLLAAFAAPIVALTLPALNVPACPQLGSIEYDTSDPNRGPFPPTRVDVCYSNTAIQLTFTAYNETSFYYNRSQTTNGEIYNYEVMEAFIYHGTNDPQTYLEFEVNPGNVTYQAFVYNPSKLRLPGAPFDHFFITDPTVDNIIANTTLTRSKQLWVSSVQIPLGLFNVDNGKAKGTQWRMNFFRTVTSKQLYPTQLLGAWSPGNQSNFHETPFFGRVYFV